MHDHWIERGRGTSVEAELQTERTDKVQYQAILSGVEVLLMVAVLIHEFTKCIPDLRFGEPRWYEFLNLADLPHNALTADEVSRLLERVYSQLKALDSYAETQGKGGMDELRSHPFGMLALTLRTDSEVCIGCDIDLLIERKWFSEASLGTLRDTEVRQLEELLVTFTDFLLANQEAAMQGDDSSAQEIGEAGTRARVCHDSDLGDPFVP